MAVKLEDMDFLVDEIDDATLSQVCAKCMYNIRLNEYTEYKLKELTRLTVVLNPFVL
jgi:hypothetical protein